VSGAVAIDKGGTNATDAAGARTSLGLEIGTDVQAHGDLLDSLQSLSTSLSEGDILVVDSGGEFQQLSPGSEGHILKITGGVPAWGEDVGGGAGPITIPSSLWGDGSDGAVTFGNSGFYPISSDVNATSFVVPNDTTISVLFNEDENRPAVIRATQSIVLGQNSSIVAVPNLLAPSGGGTGADSVSGNVIGNSGGSAAFSRGGNGGASDTQSQGGSGGGGSPYSLIPYFKNPLDDSQIEVVMGGGSGGGSGSGSGTNTSESSGPGGHGGGCVTLISPVISGHSSSLISVAGGLGSYNKLSHQYAGAGGGGGGGNVIIVCRELSSVKINCGGGQGGHLGYRPGEKGDDGVLFLFTEDGEDDFTAENIGAVHHTLVVPS
jgi:hypothetical protein